MTWFMAINKLLDIKLVQYALVALVVSLFGTTTWYYLANKGLAYQISSLKTDNANLSASLELQNSFVVQQGKDMELLQKRLQIASDRAKELSTQLAQRKIEIREVVLQGDCPDMVQQVIDEVRK